MQMDKASIVRDVALYVQNLQKQTKKLKAEVPMILLYAIEPLIRAFRSGYRTVEILKVPKLF